MQIEIKRKASGDSFSRRLNVLSKSVMPRVMLSIRYILFELEEIEREDNFRLKRFKELKIKKQSKDLKEATKEEIDQNVKENVSSVTSSSSEDFNRVKLDDEKGTAKEGERINDLTESANREGNEANGQKMEMLKENVKEAKHNVELNEFEKSEENEEKEIVEEVQEKREGEYPGTDLNKLTKSEEYKSNDLEKKVGNAQYYNESWHNIMEENYCKCSPLFVSTQEVCQAEIPDQIFNLNSDKKVQDTMVHTEEIKKIPEDVLPCDSKILLTWLKKVLQEIVSECICNKRNKTKKEDITSSTQNIYKHSTEFSKLSVRDSIFSINSKLEQKLGSYESKYKEIIKVSRLPNEDGTVRQKRKIVTVRTDKRNPIKSKLVNSQNNINNDLNSVCSCYDSSSKSAESMEQNNNGQQDSSNDDKNDKDKRTDLCYPPTGTRSEPICSKCLKENPELRPCISAGSIKNAKKMNTITCCYPSDRRVNITINDKSSEQINNINEMRLPLVSSINVNFCDLPKNILLDLRDCQGLCNELNQKSKDMVIDQDLSKTPEPKKSASTCTCDLVNTDIDTAEKCSQSLNKVGVEVEAMIKNASTGTMNTAYIFNNVIVTNIKRIDDARENTALQSPDFSYIFSKVEKVSHDLLDKIEESSQAINTDTFFKECSKRTTMFAYIFSSYQRNEIDSMVKRACFDIPEFPYIFSKILTNTPCVACNTKSVEIDALFNDACKRSYSCTYIFNHLKSIQINAMINNSCMSKVDFPYIFSTVKNEREDQPNKDAKLRTAEIENMFKNIRKPVTEFTYILNHVNSVKINNMFKEACKHSEHFPYVFNNVINETKSKDRLQSPSVNLIKINEIFIDSCKQSCYFPYIFSRSKNIYTNDMPCEKSANKYSYIFSKASASSLRNDEEIKNTCKQACIVDNEITTAFNNFIIKKSLQNLQQESLTKLKEISDLLKDSLRSTNSGKYKFKYVYKNAVGNDMDKNISTDVIYIYKICDACTSTDNLNSEINDIEAATVIKQARKLRSDFTYFSNELECRKADILQRASDSTLQDIHKIFKDTCDCIFNKIKYTDNKIPGKEERRNAKNSTSDLIYAIRKEQIDLHKPSEVLNFVDINTMFKDSCIRKNEFTYVLNKPENKKSCELARRTTDLRLQEMAKFENFNKNDCENLTSTNDKKCEPNQFTKTSNVVKIDNMFKDSCVQKNSFTYVLNNLENKVSCELARRTSDLRHREIAKLSKNSNKSDYGLNMYIECNADRFNTNCLNIDKMVKKACIQKNEFTYVLTNFDDNTIHLARRTSHLRLQEISKINESKLNKAAECKNTISNKTDFTYLLRKALESIDMIKSNCDKYGNVSTFNDTSMNEDDYRFFLNKINQEKTNDLIEKDRLLKAQEINKMIKDSCTVYINPKYNYIFQKVAKPKKLTCTCSNKKNIGFKQHSSVSHTSFIREKNKSCSIESQSTCSFLVNKPQHRFLIQIPSTKNNSGCLGIEVMWKPGNVSENIIAPKINITNNQRSLSGICTGSNENKIDKKMSWCPNTYTKTNKVSSESNNISLIRRMLDSVKNVYVPFLKPSKSEINTEVFQTKANNVVSLISNSTTSTYSWKSCVMKTCQADIECVEKNISYSGFSFGSSLDFVSYKSEGVGSEVNSAIESADVKERYVPCKDINNSNAAGKLISFDIEMKSGSSLDVTNSVVSVKKSHSSKSNIDDDCQCYGRIQNKPKRVCPKCFQDQNRQVFRMNKSPSPSCTRRQQIKNLFIGSCSCISVSASKNICESKADHWYSKNKRNKFECMSTECHRASEQNVANTTKYKQPIRKSRSFDENECCCSKNPRNFQ